MTKSSSPGIRLLTGYQLKADVLVGLGKEAVHTVKVMEKRRGFAKLGAEGPVIGAVVAVVEVRTGREK
jgi:hypothetical protein